MLRRRPSLNASSKIGRLCKQAPIYARIYSNRPQDEDLPPIPQVDKGKSIKRSPGPANTGNERRKVRRISAGQGMTNIGDSMENSFVTIRGMVSDSFHIAPRPVSLDIGAQAMQTIEEEEDLSEEDLVRAEMVITQNTSCANVYLHISNKRARTLYLLKMMGELNN
jgi:hypothetical protein